MSSKTAQRGRSSGQSARDRALADDAARLAELRARQAPPPRRTEPDVTEPEETQVVTLSEPVTEQVEDAPVQVNRVTVEAVVPAPPSPAKPRVTKPPLHDIQALILPDLHKMRPVDVASGSVAYVVHCLTCPWHGQHPIARRVLVAAEAIPGFDVGATRTLGHWGRRNMWWGNWIIDAIVVRVSETDVEITGELPSWAQGKLVIWQAKPLPMQEVSAVVETEAVAEVAPIEDAPEVSDQSLKTSEPQNDVNLAELLAAVADEVDQAAAEEALAEQQVDETEQESEVQET